jgi:hypothetical protein
MNRHLKIWVDGWLEGDSGAAEITSTIAELGISIGPFCATRVEDVRAKSVRTTIRVSAFLFAAWLLDNWWRLRWEPIRQSHRTDFELRDWKLSHALPAIGGGYVWPPLTIASDGENVLFVQSNDSISDHSSLTPIRYLNTFVQFISAPEFEHEVFGFIEMVLARLDSSGHRRTVLHELWKATLTERRHPTRGFARRLEALFGLDPDENTHLVEELRAQWERKVGKEALGEIAAATPPNDVEIALKDTNEAVAEIKSFADTSSIESVRANLLQSSALGPQAPWVSAREAARQVRELWGLGLEPLRTAEFAEKLQVSEGALNDFHAALPFALGVRGPKESKLSFVLNRRNSHSRRFDIARLIGDHLAFEVNEKWRPVTRSLTVRQKFQRAFAAELLCPSDELARRFHAPLQMDVIDDVVSETASEYDVSERLVLSHLVNRGLAPEFLLESESLLSWGESFSMPIAFGR